MTTPVSHGEDVKLGTKKLSTTLHVFFVSEREDNPLETVQGDLCVPIEVRDDSQVLWRLGNVGNTSVVP